MDWLDKNTSYYIESSIEFSLNKFSCPTSKYNKEVDSLVKNFMKNNFPKIKYLI
jgi:hypothetical protein